MLRAAATASDSGMHAPPRPCQWPGERRRPGGGPRGPLRLPAWVPAASASRARRSEARWHRDRGLEFPAPGATRHPEVGRALARYKLTTAPPSPSRRRPSRIQVASAAHWRWQCSLRDFGRVMKPAWPAPGTPSEGPSAASGTGPRPAVRELAEGDDATSGCAPLAGHLKAQGPEVRPSQTQFVGRVLGP
jgi:hypothetical protein